MHIFFEWIQVRCDISHMSLVVYGQFFFFQLHPGRVFTSDWRAAEALAPLACMACMAYMEESSVSANKDG